jgi:biotin transport system ATP-binding protein
VAENNILFSIQGLHKIFANDYHALKGIDLDIYTGECLVIAGANGSGKTLLMRMLAGLLQPSSGNIYFKGKQISEYGKQLRSEVGLVFQDSEAQILGETVEEDIRFGPENLKLPESEIEKRLESALDSLKLKGKRDFHARTLSGGEKRRLAVAGILAMGCRAIIMDEPFANMDLHGVIQVLTIIKDLKQCGKTVIVLTHELEKVLAYADRLVILSDGIICDSGDCDEVLDRLEVAWGVRDPRGECKSASDCTWLKKTDE